MRKLLDEMLLFRFFTFCEKMMRRDYLRQR
jgi:hypothetical protein